MDLPAASADSLKIDDCETGQISMKYTCKKSGFGCKNSCGQETDCENGPQPMLHREVDNETLKNYMADMFVL